MNDIANHKEIQERIDKLSPEDKKILAEAGDTLSKGGENENE